MWSACVCVLQCVTVCYSVCVSVTVCYSVYMLSFCNDYYNVDCF